MNVYPVRCGWSDWGELVDWGPDDFAEVAQEFDGVIDV